VRRSHAFTSPIREKPYESFGLVCRESAVRALQSSGGVRDRTEVRRKNCASLLLGLQEAQVT
jgi:hypothetical protein